MFETTTTTARSDLKNLLSDAQNFFNQAANATGEKADELRSKGLAMLNSATKKAQDLQTAAIETGKEVAHSADNMVHANPWKAVAISGGVGLLLGLLIGRK